MKNTCITISLLALLVLLNGCTRRFDVTSEPSGATLVVDRMNLSWPVTPTTFRADSGKAWFPCHVIWPDGTRSESKPLGEAPHFVKADYKMKTVDGRVLPPTLKRQGVISKYYDGGHALIDIGPRDGVAVNMKLVVYRGEADRVATLLIDKTGITRSRSFHAAEGTLPDIYKRPQGGVKVPL